MWAAVADVGMPEGDVYVAVAEAAVRTGKKMNSKTAKPDKLSVGQEFTVIAEAKVDGKLRLQFKGGWTSVTAKNGRVLVEKKDKKKGEKGLLEMAGGGEAHAGLRGCISTDTYDQLVKQYESTKRLDLTGEAFSGLTEAGLMELAVLFPKLEAVFFSTLNMRERVAYGFTYQVSTGRTWRLREISEEKYGKYSDSAEFDLYTCENGEWTHLRKTNGHYQHGGFPWVEDEHGKMSDKYGLNNSQTRQGLSPAEAKAWTKSTVAPVYASIAAEGGTDTVTHAAIADRLKSQLPSLKVASLGAEITPDAYDALVSQYEATKRLDLTGEVYSGLTEAGLSELPALFPELEAVFSLSSILQEINQIKAQLPTLKVASLGVEITPEAYDQLVSQYEETKRLDLTGEAFSGLTEAGLMELAGCFPELEAVFSAPTSSCAASKQLLGDTWRSPERDSLVATVDLDSDFEFSCELMVNGVLPSWGSIMRVAAIGCDENCSKYGDRLFGIWIHPSDQKKVTKPSFKLHEVEMTVKQLKGERLGLPSGWRLATKHEAEENRQQIGQLLGTWHTCGLADGWAICGSGFGGTIDSRRNDEKFGEQVITLEKSAAPEVTLYVATADPPAGDGPVMPEGLTKIEQMKVRH